MSRVPRRMNALLPPDGLEAEPFDADRAVPTRYPLGRRMTPQSPNEALQPEVAPPPPPSIPPSRKRRRLSALSGFFSFLLIAAVGAMMAVIWGEHRMREPGPLPADKVVFIQKGGTDEIVERLAEQGVIESPFAVRVALFTKVLRGEKESLKSGEYLFKQQASIDDVLGTLVSGRQILHAITIPEGLTTQQVMQRLQESDVLSGDMRDPPKEGTILPETYKVARGMMRADLLNKMKQDQRRIIDQVWARRAPDLPLRSPFELVTLASIVEKETGKADERSRVAGVFINRLRKRMRLQSDPTIVYGLVGGQGTLGHSISRSELDKPTPYNTYTIDGLPPGPIDNPGRAALEAVANPSRTADLYFVADGTGGHAFAETVDQHVKNVQRWRQIERDAKDRNGAGDIDKVTPSVVPGATTPRPNQRSEVSDPIFGGLAFDATSTKARLASFGNPLDIQVDAVSEAVPTSPAPAAPAASRKVASVAIPPKTTAASLALGPGFDTTGLSLQGSRPSAAEALDGPLSSVSDEAAPTGIGGSALSRAPAAQVASVGSAVPPEHPKIFDASEGTPMDPLRVRDYDLNSAKTVPDFSKPIP